MAKRVKFIKRHPNATTPYRGSADAAGYDVTAVSMSVDLENRSIIYDTGLSLDIPSGYYIDLRARSSVFKTGPFVLANGSGIVDSDYHGNIKLVFKCTDPEWPIADNPPYKIGERCGQLILKKYEEMQLREVEEFGEETERGEGGFGSSGY